MKSVFRAADSGGAGNEGGGGGGNAREILLLKFPDSIFPYFL